MQIIARIYCLLIYLPNWVFFFSETNKIKFIYISSDYVFDGSSPPYSENAIPNPLNKYGVTKYEGEKAVTEVNPGR